MFSPMCHNVLFYKGMHECLEETLTRAKLKLKLELNIFFLMFLKVLHCNLVLYETWGYVGSSSNADARNVSGWIHFYLGTWTMFENFVGITLKSYYHIKDLKCVYYACRGLPYGMEDQTLLIDDKPNKVFQNGFFLESFKGEILSRNKVQLLNLASWLRPTLIKLPFTRIIQDHYDSMLKYSTPCLSYSLQNYCWSMQRVNSGCKRANRSHWHPFRLLFLGIFLEYFQNIFKNI